MGIMLFTRLVVVAALCDWLHSVFSPVCSLGGGDTLLVPLAEEQIAGWPGGEVPVCSLALSAVCCTG